MNWIKIVPEINLHLFLFWTIWIFGHKEGCQMVWKNGWFRDCFLQEAMCGAQIRAQSFWSLVFLIISYETPWRLPDSFFAKCNYQYWRLHIYLQKTLLPDNRESYTRKCIWRNLANRVFLPRHFEISSVFSCKNAISALKNFSPSP